MDIKDNSTRVMTVITKTFLLAPNTSRLSSSLPPSIPEYFWHLERKKETENKEKGNL